MRKPDDLEPSVRAELYRTYVKTGAVGIEVVLSVIIGVGLGWWVQKYLAIAPWGLVIGLAIGVLAAGRRLFIFSKQYLKEDENHKQDGS